MPEPPAIRTDYRYFQAYATRWRDNDVYGHLNNAVYYEYVDSLVNGWLIRSGALPVPDGPVVCLVARSGCSFRASLGFPAEVEAGLRADRIGRTSITYGIGLFAPGAAEAAAEAQFTHVCVERTSGRPVPIPEPLRAALAAIEAKAGLAAEPRPFGRHGASVGPVD